MGTVLSPTSHDACLTPKSQEPSVETYSSPLVLPTSLGALPTHMWELAHPPSSPAQGGSSKAWHCLSLLQKVIIILIIIYSKLSGWVLPRSPWRQAGAYEGQARVLAPAWARCCRSRGCGGGAPGRAECSTRFLIQPVIPEENLPLVNVATSGAPPVAGRGSL